MTDEKPIAFMSYSHFDDEHDGGALTAFCQRLSGEAHAQIVKDFPVLRDIKRGHAWTARIDESLNVAMLLISIITQLLREIKKIAASKNNERPS